MFVKNWQMRKTISVLVCVIMVFASTPIVAHADTVEDLLSVYGYTLGSGVTPEDIQQAIQENEETLSDLEIMYNMLEGLNIIQLDNISYNESMSFYSSKMTEKLQNAMSDIAVYKNRNAVLESKIESNILDGNINDLLEYDRAYKINTSYAEDLLESLGYYNVVFEYRDVSTQIEQLEQDIDEIGIAYLDRLKEIENMDVIVSEEIGDVFNIKWVLDNELKVTSHFGKRIDPIGKTNIQTHTGTDFKAKEGSELKALFSGTVASCGWSDTSGYYINIQAGDHVRYFVCHLKEIRVKEGQWVDQYDVIALTGNTGSRTTGPHLHMALYLFGEAVDVYQLYE